MWKLKPFREFANIFLYLLSQTLRNSRKTLKTTVENSMRILLSLGLKQLQTGTEKSRTGQWIHFRKTSRPQHSSGRLLAADSLKVLFLSRFSILVFLGSFTFYTWVLSARRDAGVADTKISKRKYFVEHFKWQYSTRSLRSGNEGHHKWPLTLHNLLRSSFVLTQHHLQDYSTQQLLSSKNCNTEGFASNFHGRTLHENQKEEHEAVWVAYKETPFDGLATL